MKISWFKIMINLCLRVIFILMRISIWYHMTFNVTSSSKVLKDDKKKSQQQNHS